MIWISYNTAPILVPRSTRFLLLLAYAIPRSCDQEKWEVWEQKCGTIFDDKCHSSTGDFEKKGTETHREDHIFWHTGDRFKVFIKRLVPNCREDRRKGTGNHNLNLTWLSSQQRRGGRGGGGWPPSVYLSMRPCDISELNECSLPVYTINFFTQLAHTASFHSNYTNALKNP